MEDMPESEILLKNGKIWLSESEDQSWMTFNSKTGRVTGIGKENTYSNEKCYKDVLDLGGCRVFPGLQDSHIHVSLLGKSLMSVDLKGCRSIEEMQKRIKAFVDKHPDLEWIRGSNWEQDLLGRYPTRDDIDAICKDKPVLLARICQHMWVVNSKVLKMAGITKDNPDPEKALVGYYPDGDIKAKEPTGIVYERAFDIIQKVEKIPKAEKLNWIKTGLQECIKHGLTAVHSNEGQMWHEYCELAETDQLPIRVFMAEYFFERHSNNFPNPDVKYNHLLSCDRIKIFVDGALGINTAAISMPYKKDPNNYGVLCYSQEELNSLINEANCKGYRIEVHVIGDKATESVILALEKAQVSPEKRPLLTHSQILREDLIPRMKNLGVIANIQPQFVTTDSRWLSEILPDELLKWSYAWKSLMNQGIVCAGGSDSPIEDPQPLLGIYDAIYRPYGERNPTDQKIFKPEECLSVEEAINLYTKAGAYVAKREHDLGQLLPGFYADFVILEKSSDPVVNPKLFASAKISQVWVAGKRIYTKT